MWVGGRRRAAWWCHRSWLCEWNLPYVTTPTDVGAWISYYPSAHTPALSIPNTPEAKYPWHCKWPGYWYCQKIPCMWL